MKRMHGGTVAMDCDDRFDDRANDSVVVAPGVHADVAGMVTV